MLNISPIAKGLQALPPFEKGGRGGFNKTLEKFPFALCNISHQGMLRRLYADNPSG